MKRIAVVTNFNIPEKANAASRVAEKLLSLGFEVFVTDSNREKIARQTHVPEYRYLPADELYEKAEVAVVLGGDGSILETARRCAIREIPILGINLGRLGYMAELELGEIDLLSHLADGSYTVEERAMLQANLYGNDGKERFAAWALNEAVVSGGSMARIVDLELSEGGIPVTSYRADGLIVSTPTGSTAYSLSAGGPISDPRVSCFCVTPICPHSLTARPLIFPDDAVLQIRNTCQRERSLYLTIDGRINHELYRGNTVIIRKASVKTRLIRFGTLGFYSKLRQKMAEKS